MSKKTIPRTAFRDPGQATGLLRAIRRTITRPWRLMEVCGGQTHALAQYDIASLLPESVTLLHGPGCPVCVTPVPVIDQALTLARRKEVVFTTFGDMMRVPGSRDDLLAVRSEGHDVRMVHSPLDALELAAAHPDKEVVFFAIGFETTAPAHALALQQAERRNLRNFSLLPSLFTVPAALKAILGDDDCQVDGFLAAGHVCAVTGWQPYEELAEQHGIAISVTGFEPLDLLYGIYNCLQQLESGQYTVTNSYGRIVTREGNRAARLATEQCFEPCDRSWRGLGTLPESGLKIRKAYKQYDATERFQLKYPETAPEEGCRSADIMRGKLTPFGCPQFGTGCTPEHPIGPSMVSGEGACAAYFRYKTRINTRPL